MKADEFVRGGFYWVWKSGVCADICDILASAMGRRDNCRYRAGAGHCDHVHGPPIHVAEED